MMGTVVIGDEGEQERPVPQAVAMLLRLLIAQSSPPSA